MKRENFVFTFIMTCISAIIGAGFASGKELVSFFGNLGFGAVILVLIVFALFFWCFYLFSKIGQLTRPTSISDMSKAMFGKASILVDIGFVLSSFITLASMLAGCDSVGMFMFQGAYNFCYLSILTAIIVAIVVAVGLKYIYKVTNYIMPITIASIVIVLIIFMFVGNKQQVSAENLNGTVFSGLISCFLYVSMNIFINIFIIAKAGMFLNKKQTKLAPLLTSGIVCFIILFILISVLLGGDNVFTSDMPMVAIAFQIGGFAGKFYAVILWFAIFTTICLTAYSLQAWLYNFIKNKFLCSVIVLTVGFILSRFGFSTIVEIFYPLEGMYALIIVAFASVFYIKNRKSLHTKQKEELKKVYRTKIGISKSFDITNLTK